MINIFNYTKYTNGNQFLLRNGVLCNVIFCNKHINLLTQLLSKVLFHIALDYIILSNKL